jgi:azurin
MTIRSSCGHPPDSLPSLASAAMAPSLSRRRSAWLIATAPLALAGCTGRSPAVAPVDLRVDSNGDLLEFRPRELSCHSGDHVRLTFRNTGKYVSFKHNWVLIVPGSFDAITAAAAASSEEHNFVPAGDRRILAFTPLCSRGQAATTEFTAPKAGDYLFICTFPGHAQSMWGVLHVLPAGENPPAT